MVKAISSSLYAIPTHEFMNLPCLLPQSGQFLLLHQSLVLWSLAQKLRIRLARRAYHQKILLVMSHPLCLMTLMMQTTGVHCVLISTYPTYLVLLRRLPLKACSFTLVSLLLQRLRECHIRRPRIGDASSI